MKMAHASEATSSINISGFEPVVVYDTAKIFRVVNKIVNESSRILCGIYLFHIRERSGPDSESRGDEDNGGFESITYLRTH
jgi:hypothetical protein